MNIITLLFCIIYATNAIAFLLITLSLLYALKRHDLSQKLSMYRKMGKEEKSIYFLHIWKELEEKRIKAFEKSVKNAGPIEASESLGITSNDSVKNFMQAIEMTSGKDYNQIISDIAKQMEQKK